MKWAWFGLGIAGVLAFLLVGLSIAGEMRYRNCLEGADLKNPIAYQQPLQGGKSTYGLAGEAEYEGGEWVSASGSRREEALQRCSPWP